MTELQLCVNRIKEITYLLFYILKQKIALKRFIYFFSGRFFFVFYAFVFDPFVRLLLNVIGFCFAYLPSKHYLRRCVGGGGINAMYLSVSLFLSVSLYSSGYENQLSINLNSILPGVQLNFSKYTTWV